MSKPRKCIFCHCTDDDACTLSGGVNCSWLSDELPACTAPACAYAQGVFEGFLRSGSNSVAAFAESSKAFRAITLKSGAPKR